MSRARRILRGLSMILPALLFAGMPAGSHAEDGINRVGYFQTLDGSVGFVFDRSGETPKQRFDSSPEILLLVPSPAARGDTVFRQEDGIIVLRETPFGALTFFSQRHQQGVPIVRLGDAPPLAPGEPAAGDVLAKAVALADHLKIALGNPVTIEIPATQPMSPLALSVLAQAIENTGIAFDHVLAVQQAKQRELARRVRSIHYRARMQPGIEVAEVTLRVDFTPRLGIAGRPSSIQLEIFLNEMLRGPTRQPATSPASSLDRSR